MTDHQLYSFVYVFATWAFTLIQSLRIKCMPDLYLLKRNNNSIGVVALMIFLITLMGFRPVGVGADTGSYINRYYQMMNSMDVVAVTTKDRLFLRLEYLCAQMMPVSLFFFVVACFYIIPVYNACKRLVRNNATYLLLVTMGAFSFFSYGVNGIRNGVATSFMVLALSYISGNLKDKFICALLCLVAINFHGSTVLPFIAMLLAYFIKHPKFSFYVWGGALLGSLAMSQSLSNLLMIIGFDERLMKYMTLEESSETEAAISAARFRWDFLIYSFMPILLGGYCIFRKRICDLNYHLLLSTYIYANAIWVILIRLPFTNRFAYLSWFLYGLVIAYPLLKFHLWKNQGRKVAMIMMLHVSFTFLMYFYTGL